MASFKRLIIAAALLLPLAADALAAQTDDTAASFSYVPNIHGVVRPRYELDLESGRSRFEVRNARLTLDGKVAPTIDYFCQVDLCDQGVFKPLDFWGRIGIIKGLSVQAGQFRMPFGVDPFRAPANYIFSNRSFIARQICNYRAVGAKASYTLPKIPLSIEAGIFNPYAIGNHNVWTRRMAWAAKANYTLRNVGFTAGYMSTAPDDVRLNIADACVSWKWGRWLVEGEYMYEFYEDGMHKGCHGWNAFADYRFPIKAGIFNQLSFQGRYDGMTAHSTGVRDAAGLLQTDNPARQRVTLGATISHFRSAKLFVDVRLDFEKYFYHKDVTVPQGQGDKAVVELVVRF